MRLFLFILIGWFSTAASAGDTLLIPVSRPNPEYPQELVKSRYTGKVLINLTISALGTVQGTRIIESSHPKLSEAALHAIVKWRYQPWEVAEGKPGNLSIIVPILFGARGIEPFSKEITVGLENTLCAYLNHEVKISKLDYPKDPLNKIDVFWHTRQHLAGSYTAYHVPEPKKRAALFAELESSIPRIIKECRRNPDTRYADYLPQQIRALL
ncbi:energy transducer TonB [Pseudomonas viridiflava]|uniref:energy transducer TonB n=1 Tax=Pseudomonas viridiflava TaxID=33069 RepID=UPI000F05AEAD|nr:energy transducer TonB [Pseudomonas viridiflava]